MLAGRATIFGFHRRENHEEQDAEEAQSEHVEQDLSPDALMLGTGSTTAGSYRKKGLAEQFGEEAPTSEVDLLDHQRPIAAGPMTVSSNILGFQDRKANAEQEAEGAEYDLLELQHIENLGLSRSPISGFWSRKQGEGADSEVVDQQSDGDSGLLSSSVLGIQRRKLKGDPGKSEVSDLQYSWVTGLPSSSVFGFQRRKDYEMQEGEGEGEEVESEFTDEIENGVSSVATRTQVGFQGDHKQQQQQQHDEGSKRQMKTSPISLPEELVENIISMIPFPEILSMRALNKSWYSNFSSSPDARVFQNQVEKVSSKWNHYCPVILNIESEWLVGYDRESDRWQTMRFGFEREGLSNWFSTQKLRGAGSLMCGVYNRNQIFVTNIVTGTWKWLPSRPNMEYPKEIQLLPIGSDAYQVLLMTKFEKGSGEVSCQLYDSRIKSWTINHSRVNTALFNSSSAYLNGVLYVMEYDPDDFQDIMKMLSYNVKDNTWTNIPHPFGSMLHEIETYELLVCQSQLMVVLHLHPTWWATDTSHNTLRNTLMVYKLDPLTLEIREVARGPPEPSSASSTLFASDNDCIYFGDPQVESSSVVVLNVRNREWSSLPPPSCSDGSFKNKWATFSFQPGLNPFVLV